MIIPTYNDILENNEKVELKSRGWEIPISTDSAKEIMGRYSRNAHHWIMTYPEMAKIAQKLIDFENGIYL